MKHHIKSIRTFIGAKDFGLSREFYTDFGFEELKLSDKLSYFRSENFGFYLQDYNVKDWIENSMIFLEVDNIETHLKTLKARNLPNTYQMIKISKIQYNDWGNVYFIHDPSGVLWHIGEFNN